MIYVFYNPSTSMWVVGIPLEGQLWISRKTADEGGMQVAYLLADLINRDEPEGLRIAAAMLATPFNPDDHAFLAA